MRKTNNGDFLHHAWKNITNHWLNDRCFAFYSLIRFWRFQWPMPVKGRSHTLTWCWQSANFRSSIKDQIDVYLNDPNYTSARYKTHEGFTSFFSDKYTSFASLCLAELLRFKCFGIFSSYIWMINIQNIVPSAVIILQ